MALNYRKTLRPPLAGSPLWTSRWTKAAEVTDVEFFGAPVPPATGRLKVWDGLAWVLKPVKVWMGSAWIEKPLKFWNGSAWV